MMKNYKTKLISKHQIGTVKGGLQPQQYSGTWGDRGKGNELQTGLEKGLSWIWDKMVNSEDYINDGFNYLLTAPLAAVTGKTKEIPRVIDQMREQRHNMSQNYAMNPVFDLISPIKGGWMLKGLMKGSPLEKQLSKAGTININGLQAYLNKASKLEQDVIGGILKGQFAGQKNIDYNALRKAVSDELITYNRVPKEEYSAYGMDRLGFKIETDPVIGLKYDYVPGINTQTYTFESPRIPNGNALHYDSTTLGHSRTFTTPDEPEVLYVMESQSDWAQNLDLKSYQDLDLTPDFPFYDLLKNTEITEQQRYLANNYLPRQIQENMIFAAQQGQKRMRYPTPETAAKIEGFQKTEKTRDFLNTELELDRLIANKDHNLPDEINFDNEIFYTDEHRNTLIRNLENKLAEMQLNFTDREYPKNHQTIINKYADFPKMFNKLFKEQKVRTVTDPKGNTWYEVDIPENFLQSEWQFKHGGKFEDQGKRKTFFAKKGSKLIKKHQKGSLLEAGVGFIPIVGTYQSYQDYKKDPSLANLGWTLASGFGDILQLTGLGYGLGSAIKGLKAANTARKTVKAVNTARKTTRAANQVKMLEYGPKGKNAFKGWVQSGKNVANSNKKLDEANKHLKNAALGLGIASIDPAIDILEITFKQ